MPKSRASGNIASENHSPGRGTGGDGPELAERLADRLNQILNVEVPVYSRSRNRSENLRVTTESGNNGLITVTSPSGRSYQVNYQENTCNCIDHRIRGHVCRHIEAARRAMGEVAAAPQQTGIDQGSPVRLDPELQENLVSLDRRSDVLSDSS